MKSYGNLMQPVRGMRLWKETADPPIEPLVITKQSGRPKKKRRRDKDEVRKKMRFYQENVGKWLVGFSRVKTITDNCPLKQQITA